MSMNNAIETSHELRKHLGRHLEKIKRLDPLPRERGLTNKLRKQLKNDHGSKCAYCNKGGYVEAAHLIPLEVGGITDKTNLILLCKKCHRLYDLGCLSICAMKQVAKEWKTDGSTKSLRPVLEYQKPPPMIPPPKSVENAEKKARDFEFKRWYCKAISTYEKALKDDNLDREGRSYLRIRCAELTRRRSAVGVLMKASRILEKTNPRELSRQYLPLFYYELGYVHMLKGNHCQAARLSHRSAEESSKISRGTDQGNTPTLEYVAASANEIGALLAQRRRDEEVKDLADRLHKLKIVATKQKRTNKVWGGRWELNCVAHTLKVNLKGGDSKGSWQALQRYKYLYYLSDLTCGWHEAVKPTISLLEGLTRTLFPQKEADLLKGIDLLVRAFVTRLGYHQRPEGIRDAGFGLIKAIRKSKTKLLPGATIELVDGLMSQTIDGTSFLWPWKTD